MRRYVNTSLEADGQQQIDRQTLGDRLGDGELGARDGCHESDHKEQHHGAEQVGGREFDDLFQVWFRSDWS